MLKVKPIMYRRKQYVGTRDNYKLAQALASGFKKYPTEIEPIKKGKATKYNVFILRMD